MAASAGAPSPSAHPGPDDPDRPQHYRLAPGVSALRVVLLAAGGTAVAALVCAFALHELMSVDFWWHLRLGQYITELKQVPVTDPFTLTAEGRPYIDSHWLFQVAMWGVYLAGGINGITVSVAAVALITWVCVALTHGRVSHYGTTLLFVGLGVVAASERYLPRPDLVSICFLAVTGLLMAQYRTHGRRAIFLLPLLHVIWVNSHGLWILGVIVVGAHLVGDWVTPRFPMPAAWRGRALTPARLKVLGIVLATMVPLSFLTPQPLRQALYPFTLFREIQSGADWVAASIAELNAPLAAAHWSIATWAFVLLLGGVLSGFLVNWRRLDPVELVLTAAFVYVAVTARRNMALFAVVATPIAIRQWHTWAEVRGAGAGRRGALGQASLAGAAVLLCLAVAWQVATDRLARRDGSLKRFGLGIAAVHHPQRLADFMEAADVPGPVWNTPALGGYLTWRFWPQRRTFIDGRWEIYGQPFLERYSRAMNDMAVWEAMAERYGLQSAVIFHQRPEFGPLLGHLYTSRTWALVYADQVAVLFVKRTPANRSFVLKHKTPLTAGGLPSALPANPVVLWEDAYRDEPHLVRLEETLRRWPARSANTAEYSLLGNLCFVLEADDAAAELFTRALAADAQDYVAHISLGYLHQREERLTSAAEHFVAAAEARRWEVEPWLRLTEVALSVGNVPQAAENIAEAKSRAPHDPRIPRLDRAVKEILNRLE